MQRIQINMKNWHAQQLDMTNFLVAAWLDGKEGVLLSMSRRFIFGSSAICV